MKVIASNQSLRDSLVANWIPTDVGFKCLIHISPTTRSFVLDLAAVEAQLKANGPMLGDWYFMLLSTNGDDQCYYVLDKFKQGITNSIYPGASGLTNLGAVGFVHGELHVFLRGSDYGSIAVSEFRDELAKPASSYFLPKLELSHTFSDDKLNLTVANTLGETTFMCVNGKYFSTDELGTLSIPDTESSYEVVHPLIGPVLITK